MIVCETCHRILEPTRTVCGECGTPAPPPALARPPKSPHLAIAFEDVAEGTPIQVGADDRAFVYADGAIAAVFGRGRHVVGFDSFVLLMRVGEVRAPLPAPSDPALASTEAEHALTIVVEAPGALLNETRNPRVLVAGGFERSVVERARAAIEAGEGSLDARLAPLVAELAAVGVRLGLVAQAGG